MTEDTRDDRSADPEILSESDLSEVSGGVSLTKATLGAAALSSIGAASAAGSNGATPVPTPEAPNDGSTDYIGGPRTIDKARHSALLSTIRYILD